MGPFIKLHAYGWLSKIVGHPKRPIGWVEPPVRCTVYGGYTP